MYLLLCSGKYHAALWAKVWIWRVRESWYLAIFACVYVYIYIYIYMYIYIYIHTCVCIGYFVLRSHKSKLEVGRPAWFSEKFPTSRSRSKSSPPWQNSMTLGWEAHEHNCRMHWSFADENWSNCSGSTWCQASHPEVWQKETRHMSEASNKEATKPHRTSVHGLLCACL